VDWKDCCIEVKIRHSGKYYMLSRIPAKEQNTQKSVIDVYRRKTRILSHHRSYDIIRSSRMNIKRKK